MTFGYEQELFLKDGAGTLVVPVPTRFPRDGTQNLVEVRSNWYPDPSVTEQSFCDASTRMGSLARQHGYILHLSNQELLPGFTFADPSTIKVEWAGFHIHFGTDKLIDLPILFDLLDAEFKEEIEGASRTLSTYRMKPHGFEYRSLPATVSVGKVTRFLTALQLSGVV